MSDEQKPKPEPQPKARGFTFTEMLLTLACLLVLAAVFLPALAKSNGRSSRLNCNNNMKQIGLSFLTWSLDNGDHFPMRVSQ